MADWEEMAEIWELAGRHLVGPACAHSVVPAKNWKLLCDILSKIPDSGIAVHLPLVEHEEEDGYIIIAYRAQNSVAVSIPTAMCEEQDPPVFAGDNEEGAPWLREFDFSSDWFCVEALWSLVNEGRGVTGHVGKGGMAARRRVSTACKPLALAAKRVKLEFFVCGSSVVCFCGKEVYAWAESENAWRGVSEMLDIDWDYCTLDDA